MNQFQSKWMWHKFLPLDRKNWFRCEVDQTIPCATCGKNFYLNVRDELNSKVANQHPKGQRRAMMMKPAKYHFRDF